VQKEKIRHRWRRDKGRRTVGYNRKRDLISYSESLLKHTHMERDGRRKEQSYSLI